jgi:group I intron endonuclease
MTCGIYCIENIIDNKKYIGKSVNIEKRWEIHKRKLFSSVHVNIHLLNAWNKYGETNFIFRIIEECSKNNLDKKEIFYINYFDTINNGYNKTNGGGGFLMHHSETSKKKISESLKKQWELGIRKGKPLTQEQREKLKGRIPWNKGKKGICINRKLKNSMSCYFGVSFHIGEKRKKKWVARFGNKYLGYYETEIEAAKARDVYIIENGIPHKLNFPKNI